MGDRSRIRFRALPTVVALLLGSVFIPDGQAVGAARAHEQSRPWSGIAFRAGSSATNGTDTKLVIPVPAGVVAGDVLLASVLVRGPATVTEPGGWNKVRSDARGTLYSRIASSSEAASYAWTLSASRAAAGAMAAYTSVHSSPIMASSGQTSGASVSITAPSVTIAAPNAMVVGFFGVARRTAVTQPSGMIERVERQSAPGKPELSVEVSDYVQALSGSTGDKVAIAGVPGAGVGQLVALVPAAAPAPTLSVSALNSYSAQLEWILPEGTTEIQILRDGRLIDDLDVTGVTSYVDYLLWPSTTYSYDVKAFDSLGGTLADLTDSSITPAQTGAFPKPYASTSFINQAIGPNPPIDPNSTAMVSRAILAYVSGANLNKSDTWAYPIAYSSEGTESYLVECLLYGCGEYVGPFPIPRYAAPSQGSDGHVTVVDPLTNDELDMWQASYDDGTDTWSASSRYQTGYDGWGALCSEGQHCGSAVAAGFAEFAGVLRPEEVAQGHIDHALVFVTPYTRSGFIACPATHTDGVYNDTAAIPEGARIQLDPSFDVDAQSWPSWKKTIARALQTYGAYLADTGGSLSIRGESNLLRGYDAWALAGVTTSSLSDLPWDQFRVIKLEQC
jgi:hypothetical protein